MCDFVVILLVCYKTDPLLNHILIITLYMSLYLKCSYINYFVVFLKQTTELKKKPTAKVPQFRNSRSEISQTVSQSRGSCKITDNIISLA